MMTDQPLYDAYNAGRASFRAGDAEPAKGATAVEKEFRRGYMMTRKHTRFAEIWRVQHCYRTHAGGITCEMAKEALAPQSTMKQRAGQ